MQPERIKYRKLVHGFLTALVLFSFTDFIQTMYLVNNHGIGIEANPVVRKVLSNNGFVGFFFIKVITIVILAYLLMYWVNHPIDFYRETHRKALMFLMKGVSFMYIAVILINLYAMVLVMF